MFKCSKHDDQDDDKIKLLMSIIIGIRQVFTRQNFPNPDSSKFSTVKILRRTVVESRISAKAIHSCATVRSIYYLWCYYMALWGKHSAVVIHVAKDLDKLSQKDL